jgi:thioredoxin-like negative regulator of GroEL
MLAVSKHFIILVSHYLLKQTEYSRIFVEVLTLIKSNQYQRVKDLIHKYLTIQPMNSQAFCLMAKVLEQTNDIENSKSW